MDARPTDPALWSARDQAATIASGDLASRELLDHLLRRIERLDGAVNSVVTLDVERASVAAAAADDAVAARRPLGPLHGLPITVKDAIETAGIRSTGGAIELADHVPAADAPVVASLRGTGAVVFGKTNLPRWSGDLQTFNGLFGTTNNPWDRTLTPGGSSGGAAAAVAMGFTSFETGTDIGGSIRLPSAFCGVFGHKPSWGLVPTHGYLDSIGGGRTEADVNVFGPIARSADDLDLLLSVMAGPAPDRAPAWRLDLPPAGEIDPRRLRVAAWLDDPWCPTGRAELVALEAAAAAFESAGATVDRDARPALGLAEASPPNGALVSVAISPSLSDVEFADALPHLGDRGMAMRHRDWLAADRVRADHRQRWASFFERWDVLLCPVAPSTAFPHTQDGIIPTRRVTIDGVDRPYTDMIAWTVLIGGVYLPSTVVPVGATPTGVPVGVQVVGPYLHDRRTIAVAGMLGELTRGYVPPPAALARA